MSNIFWFLSPYSVPLALSLSLYKLVLEKNLVDQIFGGAEAPQPPRAATALYPLQNFIL